jgi:hypothetical protein
VRERERVCERERERQRVCVCASVRERVCVSQTWLTERERRTSSNRMSRCTEGNSAVLPT